MSVHGAADGVAARGCTPSEVFAVGLAGALLRAAIEVAALTVCAGAPGIVDAGLLCPIGVNAPFCSLSLTCTGSVPSLVSFTFLLFATPSVSETDTLAGVTDT
jgi:hypothetical protein